MASTADDLVGSLRGVGLRITPTRRAVCEVLAEAGERHLTAADLQRMVEEKAGRRVDASTVYRTIDALERSGLLHHVHLGHGPGLVHLSADGTHHHIVCEVCGRTVDLPPGESDLHLDELLARHGYRRGSVHFALVARCADHRP